MDYRKRVPALPATVDGPRQQLIDGEVVVNDPAALHGHVQTNVLGALVNWIRAAPAHVHAVVPRDITLAVGVVRHRNGSPTYA